MKSVRWIRKALLLGLLLFFTFFAWLSGSPRPQPGAAAPLSTIFFQIASAMAQDRVEPVVIRWPDRRFPARTLQHAIDLLRDDDTLRIAPGTYRIDEPLVVRGKSVIIEGAGCSPCPEPGPSRGRGAAELRVRRADNVTYLIGPASDRVPSPDDAVGLFNFYGAGGVIRGMNGSGFDAFLVTRDLRDSRSRPVLAAELNIHHAGRGILGTASSDLWVTDTYIHDVTHNGASFATGLADLVTAFTVAAITNSYITNVGGVCYFGQGVAMVATNDTFENCGSGLIANAPGGAIAGIQGSKLFVSDSIAKNNKRFGILLAESSAPYIRRSTIMGTQSVGGLFGDGIVAILSQPDKAVYLEEMTIDTVDRAGIANFGSNVITEHTKIRRAAFEINAEVLAGLNPQFIDVTENSQSTNSCGCPIANGNCVAKSAGLQPQSPGSP